MQISHSSRSSYTLLLIQAWFQRTQFSVRNALSKISEQGYTGLFQNGIRGDYSKSSTFRLILI